jgi:hypothetical protein
MVTLFRNGKLFAELNSRVDAEICMLLIDPNYETEWTVVYVQ